MYWLDTYEFKFINIIVSYFSIITSELPTNLTQSGYTINAW